MRQDPFGQHGGRHQYGQAPRRRGFNIDNLRWLILLGFVAYGGCYYLSNRSVDPYTGETVLIDSSIGPEQERAMGLQAYQEILSQQRLCTFWQNNALVCLLRALDQLVAEHRR